MPDAHQPGRPGPQQCDTHPGRMRVVIAGGGVAGLETLLALRELVGSQVEVTLLSPAREFVYRPVTVGEAFERSQARTYDLAELVAGPQRARLIGDALAEVDAEARAAVTASGERIAFDALVVAVGARPREALPGAFTFRGRPDVPGLRGLLDELAAGTARSVALTLPVERIWSLPIYELTVMVAQHLRQHGATTVKVSLVTPEQQPLELFGPEAARAIEPMLHALGVRLRTASLPARVRDRVLVLAGGGEVPAHRVITLPLLEGPAVPGLPHDELGFIPVDRHGRVRGCDGVYAAGDATTFPLKQGGLGAQQADAVAEAIAATCGLAITPEPFNPVLRGLLMTGGAPLYLRAQPQRLPGQATVAIDAKPRTRRLTREVSAAAGQPLWWPPAKIAGRYLAPFLATARPDPLSSHLLADHVASAGQPLSQAEYEDALGLALLLADCDARWGDHRSALRALDAAEALQGSLPPEYESKRMQWRVEARQP
jgi:sulfide:quinone oxidoreductase